MDNILNTIRKTIPPVHKEGYPFVGIFAVLTIVLGIFSTSLFWIGLGLTVWCALFFRDPKRVTPVGDGLVVAPADGQICKIGYQVPPKELELGEEPRLCICTFMNVFDVHINRSPLSGRIKSVVYKEGAFFNAELDKASEQNERNSFVLDTKYGDIIMVQIAGLVARRILSWSEEGDEVLAGDRVGMIRFGSRVDVYLPEGANILVSEGQRAIAGETALAELDDTPSTKRTFRTS